MYEKHKTLISTSDGPGDDDADDEEGGESGGEEEERGVGEPGAKRQKMEAKGEKRGVLHGGKGRDQKRVRGVRGELARKMLLVGAAGGLRRSGR